MMKLPRGRSKTLRREDSVISTVLDASIDFQLQAASRCQLNRIERPVEAKGRNGASPCEEKGLESAKKAMSN
jgi:hypothetical protein